VFQRCLPLAGLAGRRGHAAGAVVGAGQAPGTEQSEGRRNGRGQCWIHSTHIFRWGKSIVHEFMSRNTGMPIRTCVCTPRIGLSTVSSTSSPMPE